jgi:hypothetical protein
LPCFVVDRRAEGPKALQVRGAGTWHPVDGELGRVTVTLATRSREAAVSAANLDYLNPTLVDRAALEILPNTLVFPQAGEVLYRLRPVTG